MKHTVRKFFINYETEEQWINKMAARGLALSSTGFGKYVFDDCTPGEYAYRIELLENQYNHAESIAYIKFMEETGIEHISSSYRWVYFRKKVSDGPFDLFSDLDCKLKHFQRINTLFATVMFAEFCIGIGNVIIGINNISNHKSTLLGYLGNVNLYLGLFLFVITFLFYLIGRPIRKQIKVLKKEMTIRE